MRQLIRLAGSLFVLLSVASLLWDAYTLGWNELLQEMLQGILGQAIQLIGYSSTVIINLFGYIGIDIHPTGTHLFMASVVIIVVYHRAYRRVEGRSEIDEVLKKKSDLSHWLQSLQRYLTLIISPLGLLFFDPSSTGSILRSTLPAMPVIILLIGIHTIYRKYLSAFYQSLLATAVGTFLFLMLSYLQIKVYGF